MLPQCSWFVFLCSFYGQMWAEAQDALVDLLQEEFPEVQPRAQKDRLHIFQTLATFYLKYLQIMHSLEAVYDQIVHPQKRRVVRHVLEGVMGRLLELKSEMVELEHSDFHYFDDMLQDLKMTPSDVEVPIPRYFVREQMHVLKDREKLLGHVLAQGGHIDQEKVRGRMPLEEAVQLLQVSERARQGRLRARLMKEIRDQEGRSFGPRALDPDVAATRIQKVWLGYSQRKRTINQRLEELMFLGMPRLPPPLRSTARRSRLHAQHVEDARRTVQDQHEAEYQQALVAIKESVRSVDGPDFRQTLQEQIRQWFLECRHATGKFPDFPSAEDGGSAAIFAQKTPEQVATELAAKEEEKGKKRQMKGKKDKKSAKEQKDKKKDKKGKSKGKKGRMEGGEEEEKGWKMTPSSFLPAVVEGTKMYKGEQELKNLKLVVDREKGRKKTKGKKGNKKVTSKKQQCQSPHQHVPFFLGFCLYVPGEYSYLGTTLRQADIEPMPSLSDVRQLITLYGILPLGSQSVHERAPLIKSLLLAGPGGVGKKMLVHALCTETGANLFNLSPASLAGKYPGKVGLQYLLHMVFKVARQLQPSVVWIGDAEKTFYKKVPKHEKEMEPKRLKKDLAKVLKSIKAEDRVLLVGTTRRPFEAELKSFCKVYKKIILIPRPDYASRLILWKELLLRFGAKLSPALDLSSLAKVTDGYTQGHILRAIRSVLTTRRIDQQIKKPLTALEFIPPLAQQDPIYKEEEETLKVWYSKTPLGKKRARITKAGEEEEQAKDKRGRGLKKGTDDKKKKKA
uniref:ATPase AAA-type core domain-containing protein n=1 Tax=Denticeps clupeoides TaxID=299321 RepID=A0AAY4E213_9TELE